jgi:hypothetical protein
MKIDFSKRLTNLQGQILKDETSGEEVTLGIICVQALLSVDRDENIDGVEKIRRYELAKSIFNKEKDSLSAEEVVLLKKMVGKFFTTVVAGQALPMLDGS